MVEPQIVVLVVAGSSPVGHPARCGAIFKSQISDLKVPVAQPDRASDFGSEGWGFESLQARVKLRKDDDKTRRSVHARRARRG